MDEKSSSFSSSNTVGKPIRCKAAIARKAGEPLVIEEVIVAPPKPREVRIKIICTSLCHVDVTFWKMQDHPAIYPRILGHEAMGGSDTENVVLRHLVTLYRGSLSLEMQNDLKRKKHKHLAMDWGLGENEHIVVESVGEGVHEVVEGDTVIPIFLPDCGECKDCLSKKSNLCSNFSFSISPWIDREETSRFTDINGETLYHFMFVSSFSEYTVVDIAHVTKIDPQTPPNRACLFTCGIAAGVGAALKTAKVEAETTVAIFGLGAIGLAIAEGARLSGAKRVIGVDVNSEKFELGKKFGVTDFVNSRNCGDKTVSEVIIEMTDGGADYCFECVGLTSMIHEAYASCRKGWGKTVVLGYDRSGEMLSLSSYEVLHHGKSLRGVLFGGLKPKSDIPTLIKRCMDKELKLDQFVTHEVDFEDINKAFDLLLEGKSLRCVIWMNK